MPLIVVHGGAAAVTPTLLDQKLADTRRAAKVGFVALLRNGDNNNGGGAAALDGVQSAVQYMEDSAYFNAGLGSSLTSAGTVEMDAIICDGKKLNFGAISAVNAVKNPVKVARSVMENSEHCLFTGDGAHRFAVQQGFPLIEPSSLVHQFAKDRLNEFRTFTNAVACDHQQDHSNITDHDTVGAVSIDAGGNLAAATSTGGITGKQPGRVGDTPIIGSGAYADNQLGAVSTTGHGEAIMRVSLAHEVLYRYRKHIELCQDSITTIDNDNALQKAVQSSLDMMKNRIDGYGGVIAVGPQHEVAIGFTTLAMPWAYINSVDIEQDTLAGLLHNDRLPVKIHYGYKPGEHLTIYE